MRVFHLLRRRLALNKRLTNSLADQVIRVWVLAHRRLLVKNSRSLSRPSGKLSMRVFHLLRRRLVLNKRSTNSLGEPLTPVLLLALAVSFRRAILVPSWGPVVSLPQVTPVPSWGPVVSLPQVTPVPL